MYEYENKRQPLASIGVFRKRIMKSLRVGILVILISWMIGIVGYHFLGPMEWLDAVHNSSMILSGMGPVVEIKTAIGKWFSSFYAIFCGVIFIANIGLILAPAIHRFFHRLHLETAKN